MEEKESRRQLRSVEEAELSVEEALDLLTEYYRRRRRLRRRQRAQEILYHQYAGLTSVEALHALGFPFTSFEDILMMDVFELSEINEI